MGLFSQPKPRGFHHEYIYYDEHRERVEQARRHQSQLSPGIFRQGRGERPAVPHMNVGCLLVMALIIVGMGMAMLLI